MGRTKYLIVAFLLFGAVGALFYFHFNKAEPKPQTYWKFRIKWKKPTPYFSLKANTYYSFKSIHGFSGIDINGKSFNVENTSVRGNSYVVKFNKPTEFRIRGYINGIWYKDGKIEIWEEKKDFPRLYYLTTNRWSDFSLPVKKGQELRFNWHSPMLLVGYFKGDKFVKDDFIKNNYYTRTIRFWDDYTLKFKAAEIPFFCEFNKKIVGVIDCWFTLQGERFENIIFLKKGEKRKFPLWVDKGDEVCVEDCYTEGRCMNIIKLLNVKVGGKKLKRLEIGKYYYRWRAQETGAITIQAKKSVVVSKIYVKRSKHWKLKLKRDQTKKIKIDKGDVLVSNAKNRYYVNDKLFEGQKNNYHNIYEDGYLIFKGSFDSGQIDVS